MTMNNLMINEDDMLNRKSRRIYRRKDEMKKNEKRNEE